MEQIPSEPTTDVPQEPAGSKKVHIADKMESGHYVYDVDDEVAGYNSSSWFGYQDYTSDRLTSGFSDGIFKPITIGVCAMNKKTLAPPMQNILTLLAAQDYIKVILFSDDVILNDPIEDWPVCECLIAFYSKGFPLEKAIKYVALRKPMVFNDLESQYALMDRRQVYEILAANGVEVPKYVVLNRTIHEEDEEEENEESKLVENDDTIEVGGHVFHKPFVEKPVSAEDHNIYVYFPSDYGGGSQRLFRKVNNRSSAYSRVSSVRKDGSYIYEDFMATDGTDVKVYTVGPDYAHAEARKSPALDGKVERDESGKEVRYPVILNAKEKLIARKVCQAFKQTVCGFDLLRANGKSYVCDVNGFSFVKNSLKYYEDCSQILLEMVTAEIAPHLFPRTPPSVEYLADEVPELPIPIPKTGNTLELRCVVGVIRHGDRTPKQKMKMIVKHWKFIELFRELKGFEKGQLKIKKPKLLQKVLDISRYLLADLENNHDPSHHEVEEAGHKLRQLRTVLEMYGKFSGINRKVQFKLLNKKDANGDHLLLLILKWGGELTPIGQRQAEELGRAFRCMYPGGQGEYASLPGSGFLRLHSTYRHDLKVYASDEGRVQMTAAAFTKGLLDLEGNLASVLVHLVKRDQAATNMLDTSTDAQDAMNSVKERLHVHMRSSNDFTKESFKELVPTHINSIVSAMKIVKNPSLMNERLYQSISVLLEEIKQLEATDEEASHMLLYHDETLPLMSNRWAKLVKDFKSKTGKFDISKIPDIYDCIKYDMLHNRVLHLKAAPDVATCAMPLADIVIPQEYGITLEEKFDIGQKICTPLLRKIQADLHHTIVNEQADVIHRLDARLSKGVVSPNRHVRSRLYFTSESHVHSLVNVLRHGGLDKHIVDVSTLSESLEAIVKSPELNYMTQIVFMLFEDMSKDPDAKDHYRVDVHFSPGVKTRKELTEEADGSPFGYSHQDLDKKNSPELQTHPKYPIFVKRLPLSGHEPHRTQRGSVDGLLLSKSAPTFKSGQTVGVVVSTSDSESDYGHCETKRARRVSSPTLKSKSDTMIVYQRVESAPSRLNELKKPLSSRVDVTLAELREGAHSGVGVCEEGNKLTVDTVACRRGSIEKLDKLQLTTRGTGSNVELLGERAPGLELATELASTIEPLLPVCAAPLHQMNDFFTSLTGVTLNFDPIIPEEPVRTRTPHRSRCTTPISSSVPAVQSFTLSNNGAGKLSRSNRYSITDNADSDKVKYGIRTASMDSIYTDAFGVQRKDLSRSSSISDVKRRSRKDTGTGRRNSGTSSLDSQTILTDSNDISDDAHIN